MRFVVTSNVFNTNILISEKYDIKGSKVGREVHLENIGEASSRTLKDLNLNKKFLLENEWYCIYIHIYEIFNDEYEIFNVWSMI